jgi:hypothetical protein
MDAPVAWIGQQLTWIYFVMANDPVPKFVIHHVNIVLHNAWKVKKAL